ncbi:hypothetical protein SAMN05216515_1324 [Eubacterium pyruvativorans]|uniref:Uncharacterized protein n=1 Tax=Eubacterium pyruvativorans TaxID=155865 RepID=A0A1I7I1B3_9FIRM|nr:hypothetical protein [Eubacterium pyruvativorans]SFO36166.1 hypothetical protein SAMN05216515_1324 [Eubacterium pyruvativorans]SFU66730.1 hypothetical protein SAMN05216508_1295 [Eubacterium pyruvativorans]
MSKMIQVAPGFQYSVNIGYDLNHDDKLKNFIPTKSSMQLLKEILLSTHPDSTERARVLIGAYGKGKSHIVLTILSILMQRDRSLFVHLMPKIDEDPELKQLIDNYYSESSNKILPVIINGTSTSLPQAFLLALQRTLNENNLDIMPETNYKAAIRTIEKWKTDYPEVYATFKKGISLPIEAFLEELENYNSEIYDEFERIYPSLTAGSLFNPFVGFDVVDLYESVTKSLKERGYLGLYVVYDEFSKFLESNITSATVSDTKMLQDFAEKCNRSGEAEMHLLLISHKEISNYIDKLPKQKVDGWRGVSERFRHIHLNNNFSQTYEIISTVIRKDKDEWEAFCNKPQNKARFDELIKRYGDHAIFSDAKEHELETTIFGCYPLHPVSTFILPRLSEQIAQNERTLFTFLSADGPSTLSSFLKKPGRPVFCVITPDLIFDYFDPVFQKEPISGEIHKNYVLTKTILEQIRDQELESKIVKTISLIYTLGQFDKLKPVKEELVGIFGMEYTPAEINAAIEHLINDEYVIYLRRSNDYLKLKQTSGVDIEQRISDTIASLDAHFSLKVALDAANIDRYIYPSRYNDEREMIRYFKVEFVEEQELEDVDWNRKAEGVHADGVIYAIVPDSSDSITRIRRAVLESSKGVERCIFVVPKKYTEIRSILKEYDAVQTLRTAAKEDPVLFEEYEAIYEDLREVINSFISGCTHPEEYRSVYISDGEERIILRRAALTELASELCFKAFSETPVINNEAINKEEITSIANNSRNKIIAGLLRSTLEPNLGLTGSGQEVSIMRSTLLRKGVLIDDESGTRINLSPDDEKMKKVLDTIVAFIMEAKKNGRKSFAKLYDELTSAEYHIGLRSGVIPIYIAAVFHEYHEDIILENEHGQVPMTSDTLQAINSSPDDYQISYLDWDPEKQRFVTDIAEMFSQYVIEAERDLSAYEYAASAMKRWYLSLPRFAKETTGVAGRKVNSGYRKMVKLLRQNLSGQELLFEKLPDAFGYKEFNEGLAENIAQAKEFYDTAVSKLKELLIDDTKEIFAISFNRSRINRISLSSVIKDWCETLDEHIFEQLFENGTEKCLSLFKTVTNDESTFVSRLAKVATDLRVEDWNDNTIDRFVENLKMYRDTAESFHSGETEDDPTSTSEYEIHFRTDDGKTEVKRFDRVDSTKKGKLLYNSIMAEIDSMGFSISEQEKRQILLDILKGMC